jgi:hypothetical protein
MGNLDVSSSGNKAICLTIFPFNSQSQYAIEKIGLVTCSDKIDAAVLAALFGFKNITPSKGAVYDGE